MRGGMQSPLPGPSDAGAQALSGLVWSDLLMVALSYLDDLGSQAEIRE